MSFTQTRQCRRILVLREARYAGQVQPAGLIAALRAAGHEVCVVEPLSPTPSGRDRKGLRELVLSADVVVARGRSVGVLSALRLAGTSQVPVVDPATAVARVRDKVVMADVLRRAGVPTPTTWVAPLRGLVEGVPRGAYPLILKPAFGDNARGLRVVDSPEQLRTLAWPEEPALAQAYLPGDGMDLKLYVIGAHLTAVHKPSPFTACTSASSGPVPMDGRLNQLARLCGQLFGLTVYGVDCLETDAGPVVVEVNDFPNFTTVPDADQLLARHVVSRAGGVA